LSILSESDEWETPSEIFYWLIHKYKFNPTLDVCATNKNSMLDNFFTKEDDALTKQWDKQNWCNTPNSRPNKELFTKYAHEQFVNFGNETLMILPIDSLCTKYAREFILEPNYYFEPITGRIQFLYDGDVTEFGNSKKGYASVFFGKCRI